jgi:hypothetical protein
LTSCATHERPGASPNAKPVITDTERERQHPGIDANPVHRRRLRTLNAQRLTPQNASNNPEPPPARKASRFP